MICKRCHSRAESRDCSPTEMYYSLCGFCIHELKDKGELFLWDDKYRFAFKIIDGDYWELYENRDFVARVHKDDIEQLTTRLNELFNEKHDCYMKLYDVESQLKSIQRIIEDEIGG